MTGMAKQLAQNCELSERIGNTFRLRLPPAHKHLLGKIQEDKLQSELQKRFGESVRVVIDVAATASETPAERSRAEQRQRHERAIESIEQDPFVREAVALFNAGIDESSIRPI